MKRVSLLVTVALMLAVAMALSGVAQAAPTTGTKADAMCLAEAAKALKPGFNPSSYAFHGGTTGDDDFDGQATAGPDVFCGFGGEDQIGYVDEGEIFLGGTGKDSVFYGSYGTFYGGAGDDSVTINTGTISNVEQVG